MTYQNIGAPTPQAGQSGAIGLTPKERSSYSFLKIADALAHPGDPNRKERAAFELECSAAAEAATGSSVQGGVRVPEDVLHHRDMTVGTAADGGYLKGTDHMGGSFIDQLRNRMMVLQMGATTMSGLVGDVVIPKQTAGHTAYWVAEDGAATESKPTLSQLSLSPKTISAYSDISRKLAIQSSPDAEALVKADLARCLALGIDDAALHGDSASSSNQPDGLTSTQISGVGSVAGDTDGLAPDLGHLLALESAVAAANADVGQLGFLTSAKVRGVLKQTFANGAGGDTPLWTPGSRGNAAEGDLVGYRAGCSNQVKDDLTKGASSGVCSEIFFGNWSDLIIGMWRGLDLLVDPYSLSTTGQIRLVAFQSVDIGLRNASSFAVMRDALTA